MFGQLKKLSLKEGLKTDIFPFEKMLRKNKNCRVAMTTAYTNTSCDCIVAQARSHSI